MIALDTSAIVAIACSEPEEEAFNRLISTRERRRLFAQIRRGPPGGCGQAKLPAPRGVSILARRWGEDERKE